MGNSSSVECEQPHELAPGLSSVYDDELFNQWMESDPILTDPRARFMTYIDQKQMTVYIAYIRLDKETPWPWVYLRLAWYEARGYSYQIERCVK